MSKIKGKPGQTVVLKAVILNKVTKLPVISGTCSFKVNSKTVQMKKVLQLNVE